MSEISKEAATEKLLESFAKSRTRRSLLKGAIATTGVVAATSALATVPSYALTETGRNVSELTGDAAAGRRFKFNKPAVDSAATILTVARTAEQLAVTFYSHGIANASQLGISGDNLEYLRATMIEEQIHQQFFTTNGGASLAETFSFPNGSQTFSDLKTFIATQQQFTNLLRWGVQTWHKLWRKLLRLRKGTAHLGV